MTYSIIGKSVDVLDKGYITLSDIMGTDGTIMRAARMSYMNNEFHTFTEEQNRNLIFKLMRQKHTTPFEQVEFQFEVKAPLLVCWQWFRHRTWSFNVQSGRYGVLDEMYIPETLHSTDSDFDNYLMHKLYIHYEASMELYKEAIATNVRKEKARLFLPGFAMYYTFVAKVDAHNLMHFLRLRVDSKAQYEIRQYANVIYDEFFKLALPITAEAFAETI